jgi:sulfane dehydrogenase subunit SoxC
MDTKDTKSKQSSRRRFLQGGAALAGLVAAAGVRRAAGQSSSQSSSPTPGQNSDKLLGTFPSDFDWNDPRLRTDYVPDESVPKEAIWKDPWTSEPMRSADGDLVVDWTGTPQWEAYRKNIRAAGGPRYGNVAKDNRLVGARSRFVTTHRLGFDGGSGFGASGIPIAPSTSTVYFMSLGSPLEDQLGIITPAGLHFWDEHGEIPEIDPREHRLTIYGMVDRPLTLTMEDLMDLPSVSRPHFLDCNSNGTTGYRNRVMPWATPGLIFHEGSCSEWTGVLLSTLLDMAGVQKGARWFYASAEDEYNQTWSIPIWKAMDDAMVAYGQNGEPVRPEQGFPIRLLVPGFQGTMNIKRLRRIKVTDEATLFHRLYTEMFPDDKYTWFRMEHPPKSCILRPSGQQQLRRHGFYEIRGIAWSGGGKITKVEVTVDGGKTWKDAEIQGPAYSKAYTRFVYPWSWNGEEVTIASRCTDERGSTQPTTAEFAKVVGASLEEVKGRGYPRFNVPQPWKIGREGKVTNAIFSI